MRGRPNQSQNSYNQLVYHICGSSETSLSYADIISEHCEACIVSIDEPLRQGSLLHRKTSDKFVKKWNFSPFKTEICMQCDSKCFHLQLHMEILLNISFMLFLQVRLSMFWQALIVFVPLNFNILESVRVCLSNVSYQSNVHKYQKCYKRISPELGPSCEDELRKGDFACLGFRHISGELELSSSKNFAGLHQHIIKLIFVTKAR